METKNCGSTPCKTVKIVETCKTGTPSILEISKKVTLVELKQEKENTLDSKPVQNCTDGAAADTSAGNTNSKGLLPCSPTTVCIYNFGQVVAGNIQNYK